MKESAKEIKLPFVKIPLSNGKIDRKVVLESVKTHLGEGTKALVTPDVEIIPLRNAMGGKASPFLLGLRTLSLAQFLRHTVDGKTLGLYLTTNRTLTEWLRP